MELLQTVKRKTFLSEIAYYALNIGLAAVLVRVIILGQAGFKDG